MPEYNIAPRHDDAENAQIADRLDRFAHSLNLPLHRYNFKNIKAAARETDARAERFSRGLPQTKSRTGWPVMGSTTIPTTWTHPESPDAAGSRFLEMLDTLKGLHEGNLPPNAELLQLLQGVVNMDTTSSGLSSDGVLVMQAMQRLAGTLTDVIQERNADELFQRFIKHANMTTASVAQSSLQRQVAEPATKVTKEMYNVTSLFLRDPKFRESCATVVDMLQRLVRIVNKETGGAASPRRGQAAKEPSREEENEEDEDMSPSAISWPRQRQLSQMSETILGSVDDVQASTQLQGWPAQPLHVKGATSGGPRRGSATTGSESGSQAGGDVASDGGRGAARRRLPVVDRLVKATRSVLLRPPTPPASITAAEGPDREAEVEEVPGAGEAGWWETTALRRRDDLDTLLELYGWFVRRLHKPDQAEARRALLGLVEAMGDARLWEVRPGDASYDVAMRELQMMMERFASNASMDPLLGSVRALRNLFATSPELVLLRSDTYEFLRRCLREPAFASHGDTMEQRLRTLVTRMIDQVAMHARIREAMDVIRRDSESLWDGLRNDSMLQRLGDDSEEVWRALVMDATGKQTFKISLIQDFTNVILPSMWDQVKTVPVPRRTIQNRQYMIVFDDMSLSLDDAIPKVLQVDFLTTAYVGLRRELTTAVDHEMTLTFHQMHADIKNLPFMIRKRSGIRYEDYGVASVLVGGEGLRISTRLAVDLESTTRTLILKAPVKVTMDIFKVLIAGTKHDGVYDILRPTIETNVRHALCVRVGEEVLSALKRLDATATAIKRRFVVPRAGGVSKTRMPAGGGPRAVSSGLRTVGGSMSGGGGGGVQLAQRGAESARGLVDVVGAILSRAASDSG